MNDNENIVKENKNFSKSDIGAQSAWKGFTSQTLYIASRIATDVGNYDFFPEDIEDLVVKKDGIIIEAVQVKNISSNLTLSSLAATKSSKSGEGFFNRICSLHESYPLFSKVRIVYFNDLGEEIEGFVNGKEAYRKSILKKLTDNHNISADNAEWLLSSLVFERVNSEHLKNMIADQLRECVPIMAAPDLAQSLLVQYVSDLSRTKGSTSFKQWQEQIYEIGTDIAAIDGYYKEYQKSLLRLYDLTLDKSLEQLENEFKQGISAHPTHIRNNLDFNRPNWINKISETIDNNKAVIIKGVSGQGKSTLCYRYLIDYYPEQLVFCVRRIGSIRQAENLAIALKGIAKHTSNMIVYIDVNPGEEQWILLIQELQARGVSIPALVSIREEDFKMTRVEGSSINFEIFDLYLSKQEAQNIYEIFTSITPHPQFRSFEESWTRFGQGGPIIEFSYLLTNNQTLKQRLKAQIDNLLQESHPDSWFSLLQLVCFAGQTGCPLVFNSVKKEVSCNNSFAAIQRLSNEYLIRKSEDGVYIEAFHPIRAQVICDILIEKIGENSSKLMLSALKCIDSNYSHLFLLDYFSKHSYSKEIVTQIAALKQRDWIFCAGLVKTMLWLDVKRYVEKNHQAIDSIIKRRGRGWLSFMPLDISGLIRPNELIIESLVPSLPNINIDKIRSEIEQVRDSLTSLHIDYEATDLLIKNCTPPSLIPRNDNEWSLFGYSLFWFAKRKRSISLSFTIDQLLEEMLYGDIKSKSDAIRGMYEQNFMRYCNSAIEVLSSRMIKDYCIIHLNVTEVEVQCYCVPPVFDNDRNTNISTNFNHHWKMKVLDILDQMYCRKDYIEVALIGVNLLKDLGIEPVDHKARIHKSNRNSEWITEVNGWMKPRIDYYYRPDAWEYYVSQIDEIRKSASKLISDTIAYLEFLYKKQRHNENRWKKISEGISSFKQQLYYDNLLPKTVVDKYCLFGEGMKKTIQNGEQNITIQLALSLNSYTDFRKSFEDTYKYLELFFDKFSEILLARIQGKYFDDINNPRLTLINLYDSSKSLLSLQKEYTTLFSNYRTLEESFEKSELEKMLTLVNIWAHVFEHPIKGYPIAYDAKELYRKSGSIIKEDLQSALHIIGGKANDINGKIYITVDFNPFSEDTLESVYKYVVLTLSNEYKDALSFSSVRWYMETQSPELIYVPVYEGVPFPSGFQIPYYRILSTKENQMSFSLLAAELPIELYSKFDVYCNEINQWKLAMGYLGSIKMLIIQYNEVINILSTSKAVCENGVNQYIDTFINHLSDMVSKFSNCITLPLRTLEPIANEDITEALHIIENMIDEMQIIQGSISRLQKVRDIDHTLDNALGCMMLVLE